MQQLSWRADNAWGIHATNQGRPVGGPHVRGTSVVRRRDTAASFQGGLQGMTQRGGPEGESGGKPGKNAVTRVTAFFVFAGT